MANPIYCDADGCDSQADIMINNMAIGDVKAYCNGHFAELVFHLAVQMTGQEEDAPNEIKERKSKKKEKVMEGGLENKTEITDIPDDVIPL